MTTECATQSNYSQTDISDLLKQYYKRLFPYKLYFKWLQYGNGRKNYFENREFSFTLKDDVYIRFLSFADASELEKEMQKKVPYKIDIGAVYNHKPKDHKQLQAGAFKAEEKELVFDIDMTDYDDIRTCCSGASICNKCWPLMTVALKVIDTALREDFGFDHLLWVYSGRRGIHCWVADEAARKLSQQGRSAVAEYLNIIKGGESQQKKVNFKSNNLHPSLQRASKVVENYFKNHYLQEQNILETSEQQSILLKLIADQVTREKVETAWKKKDLSCKEKWDVLERIVDDRFAKNKHTLLEIMFQYVYPRLDINVSKGLNHLLKSPFCVHPKTGRICVPMDPSKADSFDPMAVPTISQLFEELDEAMKEENDLTKDKKDYMKTSLRSGIELFEKFLKGLSEENNNSMKKLKETKKESLQF